VENVQPPGGVHQPRSRLLSLIRAFRPPPDALVTRMERVLAVVATALAAAALMDVVVRGL
jgi:hypothetical protein